MEKSKRYLILSFIIFIGIIAIISIAGIYLLGEQEVLLQGQIEATQVRISGKTPGRIEAFLVKKGQKVQKGDTLVIINSPEVTAKYTQAQAAEDIAKFQNEKVDKGTRWEIVQTAFELWQKAKSDLALATKTHERTTRLYEQGVVTLQRKDEVDALYNAAVAAEKATHYQYDMAKAGAEKEDRESSNKLVTIAQETVNEVGSFLADTKLTSPTDGEIADIYPSVGELVGAGSPLLNVVDLNDVYAIINVREDLLPGFTMGKEIFLDIPALGLKNQKFKIDYISPLGSYATWKSTRESGSYDLKTFEVQARPVSPIANLRPGMSVLQKIK